MGRSLLVPIAVLAAAGCGSFGEQAAPSDASAPDGANGTDGGALVEAGEGGIPPGAHCPAGRGAAMIDTGKFCIDATEATVAHYAQFMSQATPELDEARCKGIPLAPGSEASCANFTFDSTSNPLRPVRCVSWCNAYAYCKWANKRLCGALAPGGGPFEALENPAANEWSQACTGGDATKRFPYGPTYDATKCITERDPSSGPDDVASTPGCVGGFPGLFDMSGNLREWVDACTATACLRMGGSYAEKDNAVSCSGGNLDRRRDEQSAPSGIRCCADRAP